MTELPNFDALWNYYEPQATEQKFRELLPEAEASGNRSYYAELLTQIARTEGLQRKFDDAHRTLDAVEPLLPADTTIARVRYELERGRAFNSSGYKSDARQHFLRAWELASEISEDFYAIDAAHMMGIVEQGDESLAWNTKAMEAAEKTENTRAKGWIGSLSNNIGWTYHDKGDYETALQYFEKCLAWHSERNTGKGQKIAKWSVARALRSLGRTEEALQRQQSLLKEYEAEGGDDGYVFEEIGECLLALQRVDESRSYFAKAYELLGVDEWLKANEVARLERLKLMAKM